MFTAQRRLSVGAAGWRRCVLGATVPIATQACGARCADPHHRCGSDVGWFGYAIIPEWNTHKPGRRGNLHANLLNDIAQGEFTRPELSAILQRAGFGWVELPRFDGRCWAAVTGVF